MEGKNKTIIAATELVKRFGKVTAVDRLSLSVHRGEVFGLLGPNGAGKTTTIRMLTGLIMPDSGEVSIDGIDMRKNPIRGKLKMGVVPELGNVYIDLTAMQNLLLAGRFYGYNKKELAPKAGSLFEQFELYDRKDDLVRTFSKGMAQRVNIMSALIHDPEILFLDEPTSGLDVKSQRLIKDTVRLLSCKGTTVVLTTHNLDEANILCERICIMNRGRVRAVDSPETLKIHRNEVQSVEVAFSRHIDLSSTLQGVQVSRIEKRGDKWKLYTPSPDSVIKTVVKTAEKLNVTLTTMNLCKAELEDIFITLTEEESNAG
jgi:ABC-2 type transport system ATP-binding protein